jgi:urease gamma subunit
MTWLNRGFKIRHKFTKEKEMKAEAIRALEQFKQLHLAREVETSDGQADMASESPQPTEENQMEQRDLGAVLASWEEGEKAKKQKGVNFNYPDHIAPLKQRILSALNNGARSVESVARYAKEGEKLINLQLNLMVSRGLIGKHIVPSSGNVKYYPADIAKEMGILTAPQPINRKPKKAKEQKRSSSVQTTEIQKAINAHPQKPTATQEAQYIAFLEKRITEWQAEARKMAKQIMDLEQEVIKAKTEPRNVTGEVQEVMKEVMELRGTVAYLESKLFGGK